MKRILFIISLLYFLGIGSANASGNIKVYLYDELVDMDNPVIVNGSTLVPLRVLFESLGSSVEWNEKTRSVRAIKGDFNLYITVDSEYAIKNGAVVTLEVPAQIIDNKTYVPLRFVAESFDQDVNWDNDNNAIHIGKSMGAKEVSKQAAPAVIYIETYDTLNKPIASGSGFVIEKNGLIATNYHVIDNAYTASIKLIDGRSFNISKVVDYDAIKDIALLKVDIGNSSLPTVNLGNSDKIDNGDNIFAIGSPKGLENTISTGIISNKNRSNGNRTFIQISAEITHGSSGGALLNDHAEVIGITSNGLGEANLNFAIPINEVKKLTGNKNLSFNDVFNLEHVIKYNDGSSYIGEMINKIPNGFGIMTFSDGTKYSGYFVAGLFEGKGTITYTNGGSYEGEFNKGSKNGFGVEFYVTGNKYEGKYSNNLYNGLGILTFSDKNTLSGTFLNGNPNGLMYYKDINTGLITSQQWSNGILLR